MRIGVDARSLLRGEARGEGRTLLRLYREILLLHTEWAVNLYGDRPSPVALECAFRVRSRYIPGDRFNSWEQLALPFFACIDRVDLVHCASSTAPRWLVQPFVLTVHDIIPLVFDDGHTDDARGRFEWSLRTAINRASAIIAVSEHTKSDLVRYFDLSPDRIKVIHWGADVVASDAGMPGGSQPRDAPLTILTFGGDAPRKNCERVLEAFAKTVVQAPRARLVMVGVGNPQTRRRLSNCADQFGILDRVDLLGYVSDAQLESIFAGTSVVFYPSLYEGFGMPLVEAMGRGLPVVASGTSSIPEVVADSAMLVDPLDVDDMASALTTILANDDLRFDLARRGVNRARQLSWQRCAKETALVFRDAIT